LLPLIAVDDVIDLFVQPVPIERRQILRAVGRMRKRSKASEDENPSQSAGEDGTQEKILHKKTKGREWTSLPSG
jgi:hypothetical protein